VIFGEGWKRPPEGLSVYVNIRYACGHTVKKDVTDVVLQNFLPDISWAEEEAWVQETVESSYMCESCCETDFWRSVEDAEESV
jgi:hypothetical protein